MTSRSMKLVDTATKRKEDFNIHRHGHQPNDMSPRNHTKIIIGSLP